MEPWILVAVAVILIVLGLWGAYRVGGKVEKGKQRKAANDARERMDSVDRDRSVDDTVKRLRRGGL